MLLKEVRSRLIGTPLPSLDKCTHVTYVSRPQYTPRSVVNETELTDALRHTVQALGYSFSTVTISSQSSLQYDVVIRAARTRYRLALARGGAR